MVPASRQKALLAAPSAVVTDIMASARRMATSGFSQPCTGDHRTDASQPQKPRGSKARVGWPVIRSRMVAVARSSSRLELVASTAPGASRM
jgi:hypothetical protein